MGDEIPSREQLEAAAKRAAETQPDEIHLRSVPEPEWSQADAIETHAKSLRAQGFVEAGTYAVDVLPVTIRFLLKESGRIYAAIYEHAKAGAWMNLVILYEDATSVTFTNTQDRGLEKRPGHPIHYLWGATGQQLCAAAAVQPLSARPRKAITAVSIPGEFEKAWADAVRWRKGRGISMAEVASVILSRDGQPARVLRRERLQFIADQDGVPERNLKAALTKLFDAHQSLEKAYLALVSYDDLSVISVALCLVSATLTDSPLVDGIRKTFANLFPKGTQLDIVFVADPDVPRLERVCPPFYVRTRRLSKE